MAEDKKPLVSLCSLALSTIDYDAYGSHLAFAYSCGRYLPDYDFLLATPGRMAIDQARNAAIQYSKDRGAKWIFFWDDDTILDPKTLVKLIEKAEEQDIDIIQPLYFIRGDQFPVMAFVKDKETGKLRGIKDEEWDNADGGLVDLDATGNGCTLYRMELFDIVDHPWFLTIPGQYTEDIHFFSKMSLTEYTPSIKLDTSFSCGHMTENIAINADNYRVVRSMHFLDKMKEGEKKEQTLSGLEKVTKSVAKALEEKGKRDFESAGKFYRRRVDADTEGDSVGSEAGSSASEC